MGVAIYNSARVAFAKKQVDWTTDGLQCAIPVLGYIPSLVTDVLVGVAQPFRAVINVTTRTVDDAGWLKHDTMSFAAIPVNEDIDRVIIFRLFDGLLLFDLSFPVINVPVAVPMVFLNDLSTPGLCRL